MRRLLPLLFAAVLVGCNSPLVLVEESAQNTVDGPNVIFSARSPLAKGTASVALDWGSNGRAGQFAIADILTYAGAKTALAAPAGWDLIRDDSSASTRQSLYSHRIQPEDTGTATWTFSEQVDAQGVILLLDKAAPANPIDAAGGNAGSGGTLTAKSITTTSAGDLVLAFCATDFAEAPLHPVIPPAMSQVAAQDAAAREYWILGTYQTGAGDTQARAFEFPQLFNWVAAQVAVRRSPATPTEH